MPARHIRPGRVLAVSAAAAVWLASVAGASAPQTQGADLRVATIGHRLAVAGLGLCPSRLPVTGLLLHDLAAYDKADRAAVAARSGLGDGIGVVAVVPGSAAQQGGLVTGDEITAVAGVPIAALGLPPAREQASYDRIEAFTALLDRVLVKGDAQVSVRKSGTSRTVMLPQRWGCAARFALLAGDTPAVWSDGRYAAVNRALEHAAGDDELAFALAHEMAHVVLGHALARRPALAGLGIAGRKTREREREADRLGASIMIDAGYSVTGAKAFLVRQVRAHGTLSLTHPSIASRLAEIYAVAGGVEDRLPGS